uniref:Disulfide reductase n=1 Tax=Ochrobactrum sp. PW1 TaxID=1882222 RepID=A0A292GQN7_9HYPH|nr:disulfide reductase [Ochrobactrum sp. PW1]
MISRFIKQKQVRLAEQCRSQCHTHPHAARQIADWLLDDCFIEPQADKDLRRSRWCAESIDIQEPSVNFTNTRGVSLGLDLTKQGGALRIGGQYRVEEALRPVWGVLGDTGNPPTAGIADLAAVQTDLVTDCS